MYKIKLNRGQMVFSVVFYHKLLLHRDNCFSVFLGWTHSASCLIVLIFWWYSYAANVLSCFLFHSSWVIFVYNKEVTYRYKPFVVLLCIVATVLIVRFAIKMTTTEFPAYFSHVLIREMHIQTPKKCNYKIAVLLAKIDLKTLHFHRYLFCKFLPL